MMRTALLALSVLLFLFSCSSQTELALTEENEIILEDPGPSFPYYVAPPYFKPGDKSALTNQELVRKLFPEGDIFNELNQDAFYYWSFTDQQIQNISSPGFPLICPDIYNLGSHWFLLLSSLKSPAGKVQRDIIYLGRDSEEWDFQVNQLWDNSTKPQSNRPIIILDAGHGGRDPGAVAANGVYEKHYNQFLCTLLEEELTQRGYTVIFTYDIEKDQGMYPLGRQRFSLGYQDAIFLSIHHNSSPDEAEKGFSVFFSSFQSETATESSYIMVEGEEKPFVKEITGNDHIELFYRENGIKSISLPKYRADIDSYIRDNNPNLNARNSFRLALIMYRYLDQYTAQRPYYYNHRLIDERDYRVLKNNPNTAILLELGFLSNSEEAEQLRKPEYVASIVKTLAEAIEAYQSSSTVREETLSLK